MFYYSVTLLEVIDYCGWSEASSNLYSLPGEASFVRTTLHNEVCVRCGEYDRAAAAAAASALGIVHLYMTGAHAAFEHPASPLPPSLPRVAAHSHMHSKKRSRQLDASLAPTSPRSSLPVSHALVIWCEHAKHFPCRVQRCRSASCCCCSFLSPSPSHASLQGTGGRRRRGRLWRERERELVFWRGKSGHVGLWWEMERKGEEREEEEGGGGAGLCLQGCVMRPGRFQPPAASDTVTPPQKTNLEQDGRLFKSDRFYRWIVRLIGFFIQSNTTKKVWKQWRGIVREVQTSPHSSL